MRINNTNPPHFSKDPSKICLRDFLIICCDMEMQKPFEKIDTDFVEKCVELLLQIQGIDKSLSDEEVVERINRIIGKNTSENSLYN